MYTVLDYRLHGGQLLFGPLAVFVQPSWAPAIVCMVLTLLLFPDARLPLGRWRWILWPFLGVAGLWVLGAFGIAAHAIATHTVHITTSGDLSQLSHPTGSVAWWGVVQNVFFPVIFLSGLGSIGEAGRQLSPGRPASAVSNSSGCSRAARSFSVGGFLSLTRVDQRVAVRTRRQRCWHDLCLAALPVFVGIAILKYRLFEIDRLVSRTLVVRDRDRVARRRVRRSDRADDAGAAVVVTGRGRSFDACGGCSVHAVASVGTADRRSPVQPGAVRRRGDGRGVQFGPSRRRRPRPGAA